MKKVKTYNCSELDIELESDMDVELYRDSLPNSTSEHCDKRILFLWEPPEIISQLVPSLSNQKDVVLRTQHLFDLILTHNQEVLDVCNKAMLFEIGMCWIDKDYNFPRKKFEVSTLVGFKRMADGHLLRHKLWDNQNKIMCPKNFFLSREHQGVNNINNNPVLGKSKNPLFNSQFHIAIENVKRKNYFSEKLIDVIVTKTVPIYYGASNIEKWFDTRGMFLVDSLEDIVKVCNSLDENVYASMLPYVEDNYERAQKFKNMGDRLRNVIINNTKK